VVSLRAGDLVPADARILESVDLDVDEQCSPVNHSRCPRALRQWLRPQS
jgi:hypothetical protein